MLGTWLAELTWVMLFSSSMSSLRSLKEGTGLGEARPPKQVRAMTTVNQSAMEPRAGTGGDRNRRVGWPPLVACGLGLLWQLL